MTNYGIITKIMNLQSQDRFIFHQVIEGYLQTTPNHLMKKNLPFDWRFIILVIIP